jgi:ketosteroid isomerase-like protein
MIVITSPLAVTTLGLGLALAGVSAAQSAKDHVVEMRHRGDEGMGFSQEKTRHHFLLRPDGGIIDVSAKVPKDSDSRDRIRMHLEHIARAFGEGKFDIPMFVHDQTPPGVPVMVAEKDRIQYRFEPTENGGRVVITTRDPDTLAAIHDFLRFQIREHETGDPTTVK